MEVSCSMARRTGVGSYLEDESDATLVAGHDDDAQEVSKGTGRRVLPRLVRCCGQDLCCAEEGGGEAYDEEPAPFDAAAIWNTLAL
mmetsp:Transcript_36724/g.110232  ORF Transcript_36724/g.110232 Transcript_36724/m.110232 type:complete len:86 (+) Transcript_36724:51-308(+)